MGFCKELRYVDPNTFSIEGISEYAFIEASNYGI